MFRKSWKYLVNTKRMKNNEKNKELKSILNSIQLHFKINNSEGSVFILPCGHQYTQEESNSGDTLVEFYTNVTLLSTLMSQR